MRFVPQSGIGRTLAALWLASCLAVFAFGFMQRAIHDMPVAFTWFMVLLSFPLGAAAVVFVGVLLGSSGVTYIPFWSEVPLWFVAVFIGYVQWFVLFPALARRILGRKSRAV